MLFYQFWVHSAAFTYLLSGSNAKEGINVEDFPEFFSNHDKSGYLGGKKNSWVSYHMLSLVYTYIHVDIIE